MFRFQVIDTHRNMPVAVAMCVRFSLVFVQGQLNLDIILVIAQVYQGEVIKIQVDAFPLC